MYKNVYLHQPCKWIFFVVLVYLVAIVLNINRIDLTIDAVHIVVQAWHNWKDRDICDLMILSWNQCEFGTFARHKGELQGCSVA